MEIEAAVARAQGKPWSVETIEIEEPRTSEIMVRMVASGLCHTDLVARDGMLPTTFPVVLGHEGAGVVERVGSGVSKVEPGDHVVMTFDWCGHCPSCLQRRVSYCHEFVARNFFGCRPDGSSALSSNGEQIGSNFFGQSSFATYALGHEANVVKVARNLPLELLGPLGCGVQTGAGAVMNSLQVTPGATLAVFGCGTVGLSALMAAHAIGATELIAVDILDDRLAVARDFGATHTINSARLGAADEILDLTGYGVNYAIDTTGSASVIREAVSTLAPTGVCGILGAAEPGAEITLDEVHFMGGGRRLVGIVEGDSSPDVFIPMLAELNRQGRFSFDKLITHYALDQINEAIRDMESGRTVKPVIRMV